MAGQGGESRAARDLKQLARGRELKIALDVDHVLAYPYQVMMEEWSKRKNKKFTVDDATEHDQFSTNVGMTQKDFDELYNLAWIKMWRDIKPSVSEEELSALMKRHNVDLVTFRPQETVEPLRLWLKEHFPNTNFNIVRATSTEKFALDYDVYIDDGNPLAQKFKDANGSTGKRLMLVWAPWNNGKGFDKNPGVTAVAHLRDAIALLTEEKKAETMPPSRKTKEGMRS